MNTSEAYRQKIEAELEVAQAKLAELKAKVKSSAAGAQIKLSKEAEELEQVVEATKAKLHELAGEGEDAWERLKEGAESAWVKLNTAVRGAAARLKD